MTENQTGFERQTPEKEWDSMDDLKIILVGLERIEKKLNLVLENQNKETTYEPTLQD